MTATTARIALALALAGLAAGGLAACSDSITGGAVQEGPRAPNFALVTAGSRGIASGTSTIRDFEITSISQTLAGDAFLRSGTSGARIGYGTPACPGLGGTRCFN